MADRWLTFDCFGTLIDWRHGIRTTGELLFPGHGDEFIAAYITAETEVESEAPFRRYRAVLTEATRRAAKHMALDLKPDYAEAHYNLGVFYELHRKDLPKALAQYQKYLTLGGRDDRVERIVGSAGR